MGEDNDGDGAEDGKDAEKVRLGLAEERFAEGVSDGVGQYCAEEGVIVERGGVPDYAQKSESTACGCEPYGNGVAVILVVCCVVFRLPVWTTIMRFWSS